MAGAASLDQLKTRVHLIGAIDGQIDPINRIEAEKRDVQLSGENLTLKGGGDTDDVFQRTAGLPRTEGLDHQGSRGSRPQSKNHAVLDLLNGSISHRLFHLGLEIGHQIGLGGRDRSKGFRSDLIAGPASPTG